MAMPPTSAWRYAAAYPNFAPAASMTRIACAITSGPMPSPGNTAIEMFFIRTILERNPCVCDCLGLKLGAPTLKARSSKAKGPAPKLERRLPSQGSAIQTEPKPLISLRPEPPDFSPGDDQPIVESG